MLISNLTMVDLSVMIILDTSGFADIFGLQEDELSGIGLARGQTDLAKI